jgi:hypothetical protein
MDDRADHVRHGPRLPSEQRPLAAPPVGGQPIVADRREGRRHGDEGLVQDVQDRPALGPCQPMVRGHEDPRGSIAKRMDVDVRSSL